jgi:hypothetical protein
MVQKDLERCAEQLRSAVHQLASGSGTPQEKLRGMMANTGFASIEEGDFPKGPLRDDFHAITCQMRDDTGPPQSVTRIATMCDERARSVIEQIRELSGDVSRALGWQK